MKQLPLIILLLILVQKTLGQSAYVIFEDSTYTGAKVMGGSDLENSRLCRVHIGDQLKKFSPKVVSEYGLKNGKVYVSKEILLSGEKKSVFMERLNEGDLVLYYYCGKRTKIFCLEKDSSQFIQLSEKSIGNQGHFYREQLQEILTGCPNVSDPIWVVSYKKASFRELMERYYSCEQKPFPYARVGFSLGYDYSKLIPSKGMGTDYLEMNTQYSRGLTAGVFADIPLSASNLSIFSELRYTQHNYNYYSRLEDKDIDFFAMTKTLSLPLCIRFALPVNRFRPYIQAGGQMAYNFVNSTDRYNSFISGNTIETLRIDENRSVADILWGFTGGAGVEHKLNYRKSLFIEIRYKHMAVGSGQAMFSHSELLFQTAISF